MVDKHIRLSEKYIDILNVVRENEELKSDTEAIKFLLDMYSNNKSEEVIEEEKLKRYMDAYHERYYALFERLRWASQSAEKNTTIILDAINTMLINQEIADCISAEMFPSPVVQVSNDAYKKKIAYFKQKKDERNSKK